MDEVVTEIRGHVLVITLNRPGAKNAIDGALADGLAEALARLDGKDDLFVGVITGAGGCFSSGMDLKAFAIGGLPSALGDVLENGSKKPLIAAVEGFALAGGLEVALVCDLIVASSGAKLGIPEARVGLFAAGGGLFRLARRLSYGVAMEMAVTASPITAEQAHQHGLVSQVTEPGRRSPRRSSWPSVSPRTHRWPWPRPRNSSGRPAAAPKKRHGRCRCRTCEPSSGRTMRRKAPEHSPKSAGPTGQEPELSTTIRPAALRVAVWGRGHSAAGASGNYCGSRSSSWPVCSPMR
jgi:enoyl-CoA hydratase/carnithine racemase